MKDLLEVATSHRCPACRSETSYRYGRTKQGKQRRLCLLCGRQFTEDNPRLKFPHRPNCPVCGSPMHVYRQEGTVIRFRCSRYPLCTRYLKMHKENIK